MKQLWKLDWVEFEKKILLWNITVQSLTKLIREEKENHFIFYLPTPEADYCTVIHRDELTEVMRMQLFKLSIRGVLIKGAITLDRQGVEAINPIVKLPKDFDKRIDNMEQQIKRARDSGTFG